MVIPPDLRYTKEHEWIRVENGTSTIGITDYAQDQLGDIVFVTLPPAGKEIAKSAMFGEIESVKAVSELNAPVSGEVIESNQALADKPELINDSPYEEGWIMKVRLTNESEVGELLTAEQYGDFVEQESE